MDFVTFEIAKKLKEKGYPQDPEDFDWRHYDDWENHAEYYHFDERRSTLYQINNCKLKMWYEPTINRDELYLAPTISQALKWLREEKNIILTPNPSYFEEDCCLGWDCDVWAYGNYNHCCVDYKTYEKASIAGIEYVIDNLI